MSPRIWIVLAGICGAIGVSLGAWHAHGLQEFLEHSGFSGEDLQKRLENFGSAVRYQMYHAAALAVVGLLIAQRPSRAAAVAGLLMLVGVTLFSGLLYAWSVGGPPWLVHVVPFGGVALILGWLLLAVAGWRITKPAA